jgi:hypothetical protein
MAVVPPWYVSQFLTPSEVVRLALEAWVREVVPGAISAELVIDYPDPDDGPSTILARDLPYTRRMAYPGFPRACGATERLAETVGRAFPGAVTADVLYTVRGPAGAGDRGGCHPVPIPVY